MFIQRLSSGEARWWAGIDNGGAGVGWWIFCFCIVRGFVFFSIISFEFLWKRTVKYSCGCNSVGGLPMGGGSARLRAPSVFRI